MSISRFLRKYQNYIGDNPQGYWFKRKPYGWGWTPATWQGHVVSLVVVLLFLGIIFTAPSGLYGGDAFLRIVLPVFALFLGFWLVLYTKGESPRWKFGIDDSYDRPVDREKGKMGRFNIDFTIAVIVIGFLIGLAVTLNG